MTRHKGKHKSGFTQKRLIVLLVIAALVGGSVFGFMYMTQPKKMETAAQVTKQTAYNFANKTQGQMQTTYTFFMALITDTGEVADGVGNTPFSTLKDNSGHIIKTLRLEVYWEVVPQNFKLTNEIIQKMSITVYYNISVVWNNASKVVSYIGSSSIPGTNGTLTDGNLYLHYLKEFEVKKDIVSWYNNSGIASSFDSSKPFYISINATAAVSGVDEDGLKWATTGQFISSKTLQLLFDPPSATVTPGEPPKQTPQPIVNPPTTPTNPHKTPTTNPITPHRFIAYSVLGFSVGNVPVEYIIAVIAVLAILWFTVLRTRMLGKSRGKGKGKRHTSRRR